MTKITSFKMLPPTLCDVQEGLAQFTVILCMVTECSFYRRGEAANNVIPAVEGNANGIIPIPPNTTPKTGLGQPPRGGGGRGGRSRGGRGGVGRGGVGPVMFPFKGIIITEQSFQ